MAEVVPHVPAGRLSEAEYRNRREEIRRTYGDTATERTGAFDQELARLFYQSGWTQDQLAKVEGKSQKWIDYCVRFGRFLDFRTMVLIPRSLTERRFRGYWDRTDTNERNERIRFREVARLMETEATFAKPNTKKRPVGDAIKATSADGTWHRLATIVTKVQTVVAEATVDDVEAVLHGMVHRGSHNVFCEKGKGGVYRIVIGGKQKIDLVSLKQELKPIIDGLKAEGRKNMATMSPGTVAHLTFRLEKLIDKLAHLTPDQRPGKEE